MRRVANSFWQYEIIKKQQTEDAEAKYEENNGHGYQAD
jgi:hypothetical protein